VFSIVIFYIMSTVIFNHGMKSYHRRLIPIKPIEEIASMTLLAITYSIASLLLAIIFFIVANVQFANEDVKEVLRAFFEPKAIFTILFLVVWNTISFMSLLMLSISTAYCFRGKYRAWIGIIVFFALPIITELILHWIIGDAANNYFSFIRLEVNDGSSVEGGFDVTNI